MTSQSSQSESDTTGTTNALISGQSCDTSATIVPGTELDIPAQPLWPSAWLWRSLAHQLTAVRLFSTT